jgi:hypothetical protein
MGFNKRFLPEVEELQKIRESMGDDDKFLERYLYGPDAIIGSIESNEYVLEIEKKKGLENE